MGIVEANNRSHAGSMGGRAWWEKKSHGPLFANIITLAFYLIVLYFLNKAIPKGNLRNIGL